MSYFKIHVKKRPEDLVSPGSVPRSSHNSDLKIGTPVAMPPGTWHLWSTSGLVGPSVNIL